MLFYSMKWNLSVISCILILGCYPTYSQKPEVETFELLGYTVKLEKQELLKITDNCDGTLNKLSVSDNEKVVFNKTICTADIRDVLFVEKGYLTIIEHYSSPVGWSQYYIFDLCKRRVVVTKKIEEGTELSWEEFIELDSGVKEKYVDNILPFD